MKAEYEISSIIIGTDIKEKDLIVENSPKLHYAANEANKILRMTNRTFF